jgi:hypothetical protein
LSRETAAAGLGAAAGELPLDPAPQPAVAIAAAASSATNAAARPDLRLDRFDLLVRPVILSGVGMSIPLLVLAFLSPAPDTSIAQAGVGMCDQCPAIRARMHR